MLRSSHSSIRANIGLSKSWSEFLFRANDHHLHAQAQCIKIVERNLILEPGIFRFTEDVLFDMNQYDNVNRCHVIIHVAVEQHIAQVSRSRQK